MYIVINVLGLPFNGDTIKSKSLGGSETAGYYVARELAKRGHKVTIFTNSQEEGVYDDVRYVWAGNQTQEAPLGERFHFYALRTQHDVCIIQRHPNAFGYRWASKVNLLWLHDLAIYRNAGTINNTLWNIDGILPVSSWHGKQVQEVFGINSEIIYPVKNGVDLNLWEDDSEVEGGARSERIEMILCRNIEYAVFEKRFKLLFAARPERGLENLVKPDGIMDRLSKISPDCHLYFCGYDNVTEPMRDYYDQLWQWAKALPNCTNLGALTKQELADVERQCDLYVYPTTFEDTSCIMAMECAAAGLPFLASEVGALPETAEGTGRLLVPLKDDQCDIAAFVQNIEQAKTQQGDTDEGDGMPLMGALRRLQRESAQRFSWERAVDIFEGTINKCFSKSSSNRISVLKHFEHVSDIYALWEYAERTKKAQPYNAQEIAFLQHIELVYAFSRNNDFVKHYKDYYDYEKSRGVNYGPENLDGNHRYESVSRLISDLPSGCIVLDYGCAHGHYTINLAKRFPQFRFVGIDIAESNIVIARMWAENDGIKNVSFWQGQVNRSCITDGERVCDAVPLELGGGFDCIIAAEVLEHVANPSQMVDALCSYLKPDGLFIATTPYGPWESIGYKEHHPWRAHLWHFERGDLRDLFGMHPDFNVVSAFNGLNQQGDAIGSYITTFKKPSVSSGSIDYDRKFLAIAPRQTISLCMIVRDAESTIRKSLESIIDYVDEIVIGVDKKTTDKTIGLINEFLSIYVHQGKINLKVFNIKSPLEIGFCEARNKVIKKATCQWVFWLDADESLVFGHELPKYLRSNQYSGYAVALRHLTMEPAGLLRTDYPSKIFRNNMGVKFFGMVHEHPEISLNKGLGYVGQTHDVEISHFSYVTEEIRRNRFSRNFDLMKSDRKIFPDRLLGKWLWVRDTAQLCRWELEKNGGFLTVDLEVFIREAIVLWGDIVESKNMRLILDGLQFYSELNAMLGEGFDYGCLMDTSKANGGLKMDKRQPIIGRFSSVEDAKSITELLLNERTKIYDSKYF